MRIAVLVILAVVLSAYRPSSGANPQTAGQITLEIPLVPHAIEPIVRIPHKFPVNAPSKLKAGWAVVEIAVAERGRAENPRTILSSHEVFNAAAEHAVRKWWFRPAEKNGTPIRFEGMKTVITFVRPGWKVEWTHPKLEHPVKKAIREISDQRTLAAPYKLKSGVTMNSIVIGFVPEQAQESGAAATGRQFISIVRYNPVTLKMHKAYAAAKEIWVSLLQQEAAGLPETGAMQVRSGLMVLVPAETESTTVQPLRPPLIHSVRFERDGDGQWILTPCCLKVILP